jgi:hypothetical protein
VPRSVSFTWFFPFFWVVVVRCRVAPTCTPSSDGVQVGSVLD